MRFYISVLALLTGALFKLAGACYAAPADTLQIVNWNIEYFGDPAHHQPATQVAGVRNVMTAIDADIYAICEVVDVDSFAAVVNALPGGFGYTVAQFGSFASSASSAGYASAQKLAFVYRRSVVRNISSRAMLASSPTAYSSFSSGRFPYEVKAEVLGSDHIWRQVTFIIIHAKAYSDSGSCSRRVDGCHELKDTLDKFYANTPFVLLGDFNDDLDISNCAAFPESNYAYMVNDSAHYKALTLPISRAGAFSIDGYSSLIDHVIASDEMARFYVPGSAEVLRSLVKGIEPAYDSKVSDHFPVRTRYVLNSTAASVSGTSVGGGLDVYPNPTNGMLHIAAKLGDFTAWLVRDLSGKVVLNGGALTAGCIDARSLKDGIYLLSATGRDGSTVRQVFCVAQ